MNDSKETILNACCLLIYISKVDDVVTFDETAIIEEILTDFFNINETEVKVVVKSGFKKIEKSVDIFEFSNQLNNSLTYQDKLDFLKCIFEVGYVDGELHDLEYHYIKKISHLLNIERVDLIDAKLEFKDYI